MTTTTLPAVLLGGSANALSAARSLARQGIEVHALGDGLGSAPVRSSRTIASWWEPAVGHVEDQWAEHLDGRPPSVLIPCCDDAVELIATRRGRLQAAGHVLPPGDDAVLLDMLDKARTAEHARNAGVSTATTTTVRTLDELVEAGRSLGFPCGVKPVQSHRFNRATGGMKGATVSDEAGLVSLGERLLPNGLALLVTEIIPGADPVFCSYNTYIDDDGALLFEITKEKLRQYPTDFGLGTYHRTRWLPDVAELGLRFLRSSGMRGFGNVEFRMDARDGQLKLIECNVRLTAANELLTRAGCDVAGVVYRRALDLPVAPIRGFREGVSMWHPGRDIRAFLAYRRADELRWRTWLSQLVPPPAPPYFSWRDPLPTLDIGVRRAGRLTRRGRTPART